MIRKLIKLANYGKPMLREFDPTTIQRIKEGAYLTKVISETEVAARKCEFYSSNSVDDKVAEAFKIEANKLRKLARALQSYYESITKE